jgi:phosphoribosylcarboxyaminoimidazole (NCAIR) mutase
MRRFVLAALAGLAAVAAAPVHAATHDFEVKVLSSPAEMVTGDDALVQVSIPRNVPLHKATVTVNGADVTGTLELDASARTLTGMVTELELGNNELHVDSNGKGNGRPTYDLTLVNHPVTGPIFSGPQQQPFVCKTVSQGLGLPLVDNQSAIGMPVPGGWSKDCSATMRVDYLYRTTTGSFQPLPAGPLPANIAQTTTLDGETVPYVVRRERGTINRFIYSIAILAPPPSGGPEDEPDTSLWNGRLIYSFSGGVAIGYQQGTLSGGDHLYHNGLSKGYAIAYSTGTRTNTHYNLVLGGETAIMTKEHFIEAYGVPTYTVGIGASGGGIQQYVYGQNHKGAVIDAAIPVYSYPDMVTQTIHVGDCELLEQYMDVTDGANPKWKIWTNRTWLEGLAASNTVTNPVFGTPGSTECINGWRGLTPLAMNPLFGTAGAEQALYDPAVMAAVKWTHWDDVRNVYGVDAFGYGRSTWDNVGVQYGLAALTDGNITPAEFLKLNATAGSWKESKDMVQEGCPFIAALCANPAQFDPWSRRNMRLSPDDGTTPAPRRQGSIEAMNAAYESGLVFRGDIDIPVIDWRHYLERELNMHNSHQSFAARQRMLDFDGDASNGVIWFTDGPAVFDQTPQAFAVMDEWMANIAAHPGRSVAENKPAGAVDRCFNADGSQIASGTGVWSGILDSGAAGACTQRFPLFSTSRIVAGGPIAGNVYKCATKPVATAIADGTYGSWTPSAAEAARLAQIFPTGVCDYSKPDVGRP